MLHYSTTQFVIVSLGCISLWHEINLLWLFFRRRFWCKAAKLPKKKKSLQRYRALSDNYMENKMFISKNDRSKWPARWEFDGSSRRSGRTMSVDRLLFSALSLSMFWIKKPNKRSKCTMTSIPLSPWRCQEMNKTKSQTKRDILDFARTKDPQFQKKGLKVITLVTSLGHASCVESFSTKTQCQWKQWYFKVLRRLVWFYM